MLDYKTSTLPYNSTSLESTWAGVRRLNRVPSETVLNIGWSLPDHWKPSGPSLVPTQPVPHKGGWTNAISKQPRRILCKEKHCIVDKAAVTSHNVYSCTGRLVLAETWPPNKSIYLPTYLLREPSTCHRVIFKSRHWIAVMVYIRFT